MTFFADYLASSAVVDFTHPAVAALANKLKASSASDAYIDACFCWVRDQVKHSADCDNDRVTCRASDVLTERVGLCYAKSHLLVALLRAGGVPAGFSYQRLAINVGEAHCLHGLISVQVSGYGWYRLDPRGGDRGAHARFSPPDEHLVYLATSPGEFDLPDVFEEPLPIVVDRLRAHTRMRELLLDLPDVPAADRRPSVDKPK